MAECEKLATCPFFNGKIPLPEGMAKTMKDRYCLGDKTACARYMVAVAGKPVPSNLYPNQVERAKKILHGA